MSYPLTAMAGIGPAMAAKLKALGIRTTEKLLESAKTAKDRKSLARKLDVDEPTVLRWANLADRMRIKGVREPYAELLKDAGVDTVRELKYRNPDRLAEKMAAANARNKRVQLLPSEKVVANWIEQAGELPTILIFNKGSADSSSGGLARAEVASKSIVLIPSKKPQSRMKADKSRLHESLEVSRRIERLQEMAAKVFGSVEFAFKWLSLPNPALNNQTPLELARSDIGAREVEDVLGRFAHGVYG